MTDFPFLGTTQAADSSTLPLFKTYAWDFAQNKFIRDKGGRMILLEGNDAIAVWIYKALRTERHRYLAYSWQFGSEIKSFIGKVMDVGERKAELKRAIIECLMVNPYIKSIDSLTLTIQKQSRQIKIDIQLTTIYGTISL